jgi:imidazole glycerol phosphate synthase glutamine amidotransferase subunit
MIPSIGVLDLGAYNRRSITAALERAGASVRIVNTARSLAACDALVIPGVANVGFIANELDRLDLRGAVLDAAASGVSILGICAGFQLLFERSDEAPGIAGLGIFSGSVRAVRTPRRPHMGWNRVGSVSGRRPEGWAYFAHSFAPDSALRDIVATTTDGSDTFGSVAERGSVLGVQFHPERSASFGADLLARFVAGAGVVYAR